MKTNKILAAGVATTVILSLGITSIYAYGGNGHGNGNGQGKGKNMTQEQREKIQNMSEEERQSYMKSNGIERGEGKNDSNKGQGEEHNPGDMIKDIPSSDVSDVEKEILLYGYSEEMLARDVYSYFYELYGEETFNKISSSEQKHMDAVKTLLDRYNIDAPIGYGDLQSTFDSLKLEGENSLKDALGVGMKIEILDIEDIEKAIKGTDNDDFKIVFTNIGGASYNHMRSFLRAFDNNNLENTVDYSDYLSEADLNIKGPLKYKLAERLESAGVVLPSQVSSSEMKNKKCDSKDNSNHKKENNNEQVNGKNNKNSLKNEYKSTYEKKYGELFSKLDDNKLNDLIAKIDVLLEKINAGDYSNVLKEKYNAILLALREIAVDNLSVNNIIDIDSLFR